jgi:carbamoyl-phosphate synthase small subunit
MKNQPRPKAILLLSDGTSYNGLSIGKIGTTTGELCFNTGMTGYQEIFTDPSYFGQMMICTHTHIGNYGVHADDVESDGIKIAGLVVKNFSWNFSRSDADGSLQSYLEKYGIVGISGLDTRALVRHIRSKGAMNGIISSEISDPAELKKLLDACPNMDGLELSSKVTTKEAYYAGNPDAKYRISALDFGIKRNIVRSLVARDCYVKVFPAHATASELMEFSPDGFFLSNGPGDPSVMHEQIKTVQELLAIDKPLFGICLGHQILCLSQGIPTFKMRTGHRGINHAVKNLERGLSEVTSQNHGFAVDMEKAQASDKLDVTHINLNDGTLEGVRLRDRKAFSVQYHPEASPGPHDSRYLFDDFVSMMAEVKVGAGV